MLLVNSNNKFLADIEEDIKAAERYITYCREQIQGDTDNWEKLEYQTLIKDKEKELENLRGRLI